MIGYAIAALKKESKIIGLRVLLLDTYEYKDLDMKSVLYLKAKYRIQKTKTSKQ